METSLTMENLLAIFQAMDKIKPIDRSKYFNDYYSEIVSRLSEQAKVNQWIESNLNQLVQEKSGNRRTDLQIHAGGVQEPPFP